MNISKGLFSLAVLGALSVGGACSPRDEDQTEKAVQEIQEKTREVAREAAEKGKEIVSSTGEVITDGWITTKIKAKFFDDKLLKEGGITVDTNERVVTLKGSVSSDEAKKRAVMIAGGTEGVLRVADEVVVKAK
jgi:osmotically-inducible protein OsmY